MSYFYIKALHIIFVVTWFSALFYLGRLLIYVREALDKNEPEQSILSNQLLLMTRRLLVGISWPSALLTLFWGLWLLVTVYGHNIPIWLMIKLVLVFLLFLYHYSLHLIYRQQKNGNFKYSSQQLRIWNEVATIFLISIVMLVTVKQEISLLYGLLGLGIFIIVLMTAIRIYKKLRSK